MDMIKAFPNSNVPLSDLVSHFQLEITQIYMYFLKHGRTHG